MTNNNDIEGVMSFFAYCPNDEIEPSKVFKRVSSLTDVELAKLRDWLASKGCSKQSIQRAERDWLTHQKLGKTPTCARTFVELYTQKHEIEYLQSGLLKTSVEDGFDNTITMDTLARDMRLLNAKLNLSFRDTNIADAIQAWRGDRIRDRRNIIWSEIDDVDASALDDEWKILVEAMFDTAQVSTGYFVAVLKKFMWQVKRKIRQMPITNHLMPVWTGPQGNGKTTLIEKMLAPIAGMESRVNFEALTDTRNVELFSSYVIFLDEMEKAQKADIEAIKGVITAETLDRRVLGTSIQQRVKQNAVLIGASNSVLGANIRDTTGLRRFAPLPTLPKNAGGGKPSVNWAVINDTDFAALWQSVQVEAEDPMTGYENELEALQNQERVRSVTEQWLDQFNPYALPSQIVKNGQVRANDLFGQFDLFQSAFATASARIGLEAWGREMAALLSNSAADYPLTRKRNARGWNYVINAQPVRNVVALAGQQLSR